ncbi:ATP-dependent DNA helicase PIF1 [Tetrabaena socialis]|uniref:ATP-dependent DNA helicase PIF1 n=1 Tax=Tetrabaena socialis TaxID=47790 RepID=A0A2J8AIH2_9CHLO|nr:ATP-dependent DNA helicase PIF1 [Tetrabaena socialis]|eukprot:PNH12316.1 ATP-dependent DNA helicase PIF1 [Tetrabaena socialis]
MVDRWGMPSLFLTLTADELSPTRWPEVQSLEEELLRYSQDFTFSDAPAECAALFHKRCQAFMANVLKATNDRTTEAPGPLGRIQHYVLRFPFAPHPTAKPTLDSRGQKYVYYRPSWAHRNVSPYHPTIALLWGAHINLQRVTSSNWSFYLLKYALKCEPSGDLRLDPASRVLLGLPELEPGMPAENAPPTYLAKLVSAYITSTVVEASLAWLACAHISTVHRSSGVKCIDACPPHTRERLVLPGNKLQLSPVDVYCKRPADLDDTTFKEFFLHYEAEPVANAKTRKRDNRTFLGLSTCGHLRIFRLPEPALVRFTDFNPAHDPEGYFYMLLLRRETFRSEEELLGPANASQTYYEECLNRGLVETEADLQDLIEEYGNYHLYEIHRSQALLNDLLAVYSPDEDEEAVFGAAAAMNDAHDPAAAGAAPHQPRHLKKPRPAAAQPNAPPATGASAEQVRAALAVEFNELDGTACTLAQAHALRSIAATPAGLVILSGGPGSGKTFTTKKLTRFMRSATRMVHLSASTGAAASRLSSNASTCHSAFGLPVRGAFQGWRAGNPRAEPLRNSDVFIIDEFSMLKRACFAHVISRIKEANNYTCEAQVFQHKLIILVAPTGTTLPSSTCPRPSAIIGTPGFAAFLDIIRCRRPTASELAAAFGTAAAPVPGQATYISPDAVAAHSSATTTVLCTHFADALRHNAAILRRLSREGVVGDVWPCTLTHNIQPNTVSFMELRESFLEKPKFRKMELVAVGARVIVTSNIDWRRGFVNGATGTVVALEFGPSALAPDETEVTGIMVKLDSNGKTKVIKRSIRAKTYHNNGTYHKDTFPLALGYAITAHRSQGATLAGETIIHAGAVFAPGQMYVMLSRVTERRLIRLAGSLTPDMFDPVRLPGLMDAATDAAAALVDAPLTDADAAAAAQAAAQRARDEAVAILQQAMQHGAGAEFMDTG